MKIAFMTSGTINSSISYRAFSLAKELTKMGHEIYLFAPRFDKYSKYEDDKLTPIKGVHYVKLLQVRNIPFFVSLIPYIISAIIKLLILKPNIVHIFKANPITIEGIAAKFTGSRVILDIDDLDVEVMKIEHSPSILVYLVKISQKIALLMANGLTLASQYLMKKYNGLKTAKKIIYVPNGAEFDKKIDSNVKSVPKIIFIGNVNRKNILEPIFYAAKSLKKSKFPIAFEIIGDGAYLPYFKTLAKKLDVSSLFNFLGHIPPRSLSQYIHTGDLGYCYMPNEETIKACSSMKVFQYMQFGAIPIVSNVGDLPLYARSGKAGYVAEPSNIGSLANTIKMALTDKNRLKKVLLIQNSLSKEYKWKTLASKLDELYKEVL